MYKAKKWAIRAIFILLAWIALVLGPTRFWIEVLYTAPGDEATYRWAIGNWDWYTATDTRYCGSSGPVPYRERIAIGPLSKTILHTGDKRLRFYSVVPGVTFMYPRCADGRMLP